LEPDQVKTCEGRLDEEVEALRRQECFLFLADLRMETLRINGVERQFSDGMPATLADLLRQLHISEATVVAEVEGKIIVSDNFAKTPLRSGQSVELIRFVGGGTDG